MWKKMLRFLCEDEPWCSCQLRSLESIVDFGSSIFSVIDTCHGKFFFIFHEEWLSTCLGARSVDSCEQKLAISIVPFTVFVAFQEKKEPRLGQSVCLNDRVRYPLLPAHKSTIWLGPQLHWFLAFVQHTRLINAISVQKANSFEVRLSAGAENSWGDTVALGRGRQLENRWFPVLVYVQHQSILCCARRKLYSLLLPVPNGRKLLNGQQYHKPRGNHKAEPHPELKLVLLHTERNCQKSLSENRSFFSLLTYSSPSDQTKGEKENFELCWESAKKRGQKGKCADAQPKVSFVIYG